MDRLSSFVLRLSSRVYYVAEIVIIPFPGLHEVVDSDTHLLNAAYHFLFHVADIFLDSL